MIIRRAIDGELLSSKDVVSVVGYQHFVKRDRISIQVPVGGSVAEILDEVTAGSPNDFAVNVNGRPVPKDWWSRVRPREGTTLTFTPRLHGDNAGTLIGIAVMIAAMIVAPYAAGLLFAAGTPGFLLTQAVVGGAIMFGGMFLANALFPPRPPQLEDNEEDDRKSLSSLSGGSNQIDLYGPIPAPLGEHRYFPPFGATPYTETKGDQQYLRVLVIWGVGRHDVSDIKIGETPLDEFEDYEMEHRQGLDSDDPITLIPKDVHEEHLSIELETGTPAAERPVRFTQMESDEVSVDVVAPQGIFRLDQQNGDKKPHDVSVDFDYRLADTSDPWVEFTTIEFHRETDAARKGHRFKFPVRGQYEIRATKRTGSEDDHIMHTVIWSVLRSIRNERPINFPKPLCMTALRIKASEQLSGTLQTINGIVKPYMTAFNGTIWEVNQFSNNPADNYRHVLQGDAQGRPKTNAEIDTDALEEWWLFCHRHKYKFKQVRDFAKGTWDVLADICAAGAAVPIHKDGKWSVAWDRDDDLVVQHFTPKNSWGMSFHKDFIEETHAFRVPFINELRSWSQDERTIYDDGYNANNSTKFGQLEFPGVTHPDHIWKLGRRAIAQIRLRPDTISFVTDWEVLVCTRGDRIHLAYDTLRIGQSSGYVKASGTDAGEWIDTDETLFLEGGKDYAVRWRRASDGESFLRSVVAPTAGETKRITVVGSADLPAPGDLFMFGEVGLVTGLFRVKEIENQENLFARVTVVDDAPGIDDAETGDIPEYESHISDPINYYAVVPTNLVVTEWIEQSGTGFRALAKISWQMTRMATVDRFQVQRRDDDIGGDWVNVGSAFPPKTSLEVPVEAAGHWSFRVRAIFSDGQKPSGWAQSDSIQLRGLSAPPSSITNIRRTYVSGNSTLDWDEVIDPRPVRYEVRRGSVVEIAMTVADQLSQPRYGTVGDGTYHVAGYVRGPLGERVYTLNWISIALADSVLVKNIVVEKDEADEGFDGALQGGVITGGVIKTNGIAVTAGWAIEILQDLGINPIGNRLFVYQSPHTVDVQRVEACPVKIDWDGAGAIVGASIFDIDNLFDPPIEDFLGQAASRYTRLIPVIRFASTAAVDVFALADAFVPTDIFLGAAAWDKWRPFSPGSYKGRLFQIGLVGISSELGIDSILSEFKWLIDVPDRMDHYTDLNVPVLGYDIVFRPDGGTTAPFNGGPNGASLPHISSTIIGAVEGDEVRISNLTVDGCKVKVYNRVSAAFVIRTGVNVEAFGY